LYFPTIKECQDAIDSLRTDRRRGVYKFPADDSRVSIAQVRDAWLQALRDRRRSDRYIAATNRSFERLAKVIPLTRPVKELRTEDLRELGRRREREAVQLDTVRRELAHVRYALRYAVENISELADWKVPKTPEGMTGTQGRRRTRLISREEEIAILEYLRSTPGPRCDGNETRELVADAFELALLTGMRVHEILGLRKRDVHFDRSPGYELGWLTCRSMKTGDRAIGTTDDRVIPLVERSAEILKKRGSSELFFDLGESSIKTRVWYVDRTLGEACEEVHVPYGKKTKNGLVFHDTRHTVITRLLQNGADLATVMDLVGHKNPSTTLRIYSHATAKSRAAAIATLARVSSESYGGRKESSTADSAKKPGRPKL
jgi:integrase